MITFWTDDETRAHHHAASALRSQLGPRDLALLDAYAPAMGVPPDSMLLCDVFSTARVFPLGLAGSPLAG